MIEYTSLAKTSLISRGGAVVARQAHNLEVIGSNPFPATIENHMISQDIIFYCIYKMPSGYVPDGIFISISFTYYKPSA
jgi:hypothetical protein